ncbi:alanine/glycine:cation symporter family protein [Tepidimonas taiwanensis]|uniref:alanine/glycine:cation symporter family protein n=1 Tax=Tepidimonas taiwanensis TaxID=307486 RepID=UPI0005BE9CB8|nr:alanine/glycine:cation symporter family protein [Tepidimonas taiwanensis]
MLDLINDWLWGKILIAVLLLVGVYFTVGTRFVQFRYFRRMFGILTSGQAFAGDQHGHLSSFQALMLSVAGRVGGGNIAGVAVAITLGGPGAVFWMWVVGLLGMATSFVECTLAQAYKQPEPDGTYRGGPAYYIARGMGPSWRWLAWLYSLLLLVTFGFGFNALQSYAVATSVNDAFGVPVLASAIVLALVVAAIVFGGVRRIASVADFLVPIMALGYITVALVVVVLNITELPGVLALIVKSALGLEPALAGGVGAAIMMGVKRGLFSNEAGLGSAPNVAAVAYVPHPASQGIIQAFSVFIDTLIICSCTAFIVLVGGVYQPGSAGEWAGVPLTQASLASHVGEWGRMFVSVTLMLFAFTTMVYNYYLGENSLSYFGVRRWGLVLYRLLVIALCGWGATTDLATAFAFADVTMGLLALVNLVALIKLFPVARALLQDYDAQAKRSREEPVFDAQRFEQWGVDPRAWTLEEDEAKRLARLKGAQAAQ